MNQGKLNKTIILRAVAFALFVANSLNAQADNATRPTASGSKAKHVWAFSIDNDQFVPFTSNDRDYTGGFALTHSGEGEAQFLRPLDRIQGKFDQLIGVPKLQPTATSVELGIYGFTPDDIRQTEVISTERPYASLLYLSSSRVYALPGNTSITTSLTWGLLGTDIFGDIQRELHRILGVNPAQGWDNQISDGGEFTARYQIAHHTYWQSKDFRSRFKTTLFSSVGYLTEAGVALSTRRGLISSPDHRFNPELISYGERVNDAVMAPYQGEESYLWGGVSLKARLYNAFLQGQFRDSAHTLRYSELRPVIAEAWLGYTFTIGQQYRFSYLVRAQTSELRSGEGDRTHIWGGFVFSRYL